MRRDKTKDKERTGTVAELVTERDNELMSRSKAIRTPAMPYVTSEGESDPKSQATTSKVEPHDKDEKIDIKTKEEGDKGRRGRGRHPATREKE